MDDIIQRLQQLEEQSILMLDDDSADEDDSGINVADNGDFDAIESDEDRD